MNNTNSKFWYEGKLIEGKTLELSLNEPGLLYGATVFTTLRVYDSLDHPLTHWRAHCDRLASSLQIFGWSFPNWQRLRRGAEALLPHYRVLRMVIFADGREWITGRFLPEDLGERQQQGITAWVADEPLFRPLSNHKTGNYLGAWLAGQQAQKVGAKEAILIDPQGNWLETSTGNLWGWKNGCWYTPVEGEILPGIIRAQLLYWLQNRQIPVKQTVWSWDLVKEMETICYTNCVVEVVPIHTVSRQTLTVKPLHPKLEQLRAYFQV